MVEDPEHHEEEIEAGSAYTFFNEGHSLLKVLYVATGEDEDYEYWRGYNQFLIRDCITADTVLKSLFTEEESEQYENRMFFAC